ncbi:MAG: PD40 domain-containing protein [Planctomycetales bacterium]|nr:PD40 domain-containing protein [Planctomycetales bacterium]
MSPRRLLLCTAILAALTLPARAEKIPHLSLPEDAPVEAEHVAGRVGTTAFAHGGFRLADFSDPAPFCSPSGRTLYIPSNHHLTAIDTETGQVRFRYLYGLYNLTIHNEGAAGIRVNFTQGPLLNRSVLLEHDTGRELQRESNPPLENNWRRVSVLPSRRHAIVWQDPPADPRRGPPGSETVGSLIDLTTKRTIAELGPSVTPRCFASPDGRRLAVATAMGELRVFELESGELTRSLPLGIETRSGERAEPAWSSDGKTIYTWRKHGGEAQIVSLQVDDGAIRVLVKDPRPRVYSAPVVSPDEKHLAYQLADNPWNECSYWQIVRLSDLASIATVDVRPARTVATFSPNGETLWIASDGGLARYDLPQGKLTPELARSLSPPQAISFSPDGSQLHAVAGARVTTWDIASGRELEPSAEVDSRLKTHANTRCIYLSHDGRRTIWAGQSKVISLVDGKQVGEFYAANCLPGQTFVISPDAGRIVHDAYYGELLLGELWTGKILRELIPMARPRNNYRLALAPDQRTLAVVRHDHTVRNAPAHTLELWDLEVGKQTATIQRPGRPEIEMQFSGDGRELRIQSGRQISFLNVPDGRLLRQAAYGRMESEHWTPNRHWALRVRPSGTLASEFELLDIHTGQVARRWSQPGFTTATAFSADGKLLAVATTTGPIVIYRHYQLPSDSQALRELTAQELVPQLSRDAAHAFAAMCELIARGDAVLPVLSESLTDNSSSSSELTLLLQQLDSPEFEVRDGAARRLTQLPGLIASSLAKAANTGSAERQRRLQQILQGRQELELKQTLAVYRAIEAIEAIGTPAAQDLLATLADNEDDATATREAAAALARHNARSGK